MVTAIGEVGTLIGIVKALFDIAKTGLPIFDKRSKQVELTIGQLKTRILELHDQLDSCATLGRLVPDWLTRSRRFNVELESLGDQDVRALRSSLDEFIAQTRHDAFSNAFFVVKHAALPGIKEPTLLFSTAFSDLEENFRHSGRTSDISAFREKWPAILTRINDMQNHAASISLQSDRIMASLLKELKDAAAVSAPM